MIPTKQMTAHVPTDPGEIVEQVLQAAELGVNLAHLHARDENGLPTHKKEIYAAIIAGIARKTSIFPFVFPPADAIGRSLKSDRNA